MSEDYEGGQLFESRLVRSGGTKVREVMPSRREDARLRDEVGVIPPERTDHETENESEEG